MELPHNELMDFFDFFGKHGVEWFFIDAQPRKKNGERGAPIARKIGFQFAIHFKNFPSKFFSFSNRLTDMGKKRFDITTHESVKWKGARVVLIDDLPRYSIYEFQRWWTGPYQIIETSPMNFQALLISPIPLSDQQRRSCQQRLANKFDGDKAATGSGQPHRLPQSLNWKSEALIHRQPFCCRLVTQFDGEEDPNDLLRPFGSAQMDELLSGKKSVGMDKSASRTPLTDEKESQSTRKTFSAIDNSSKAFRWALDQKKKDASDESILLGLEQKYLTHHDKRDWPKRTLHNVKFYLGQKECRYRSNAKHGKV